MFIDFLCLCPPDITIQLAPVVQRLDIVIQCINRYPVDISVDKTNYNNHRLVIYSVDNALHPELIY